MGTPDTALERLLATEARLDALLAVEAASAEALVRAAQAEASGLAQSLEAEIARAAAEMDTRLRAESDARLGFMEDKARRTLAVWQEVDGGTLEQLAAWVVEQVLQPEAPAT